jgi:hypothetical protein
MAHVQGWRHAQIEKWLKGNGRQCITRGCIEHSKATLFHIFDVFTMTLTKHLHPWYLIFHQTYHHFPSKFEAIFLTKQCIHKCSDEGRKKQKIASDMLVIRVSLRFSKFSALGAMYFSKEIGN